MKILQGEKLPIQKWSTFGASDATSIEVLLVLGSLHYLTLTRTNIAFSIYVKVCQLLHKPTIDHWVYTKRILKHIK
jgi:hypothetical protein